MMKTMKTTRIAKYFSSMAIVCLVVLLLAFTGACSKKGSSSNDIPAHGPNPETKANTEKAKPDVQPAKPGDPSKDAAKDKADGEIDVDKLDIPDRLKEAIKSGRIPKERVKEMLERFKNGANGTAPLVAMEQVTRKSLNSYLILNGTVEPERQVQVYGRLSAYVKKIEKEEGAFVKKDSILALLDDTEIRISYQQAKIQLEQAKLTLDEEENNYKRNQELIKDELISEQDFQTSQVSYRTARLEYENKSENFKNLELQLNYTKITSPVEGFVTERLIEVGDKINPNDHVFTVEDFNPLLIKVFVPSSDALQLKEGLKAEVTSEILAGHTFNGKVKLINPRIDVQSGTVKVTVEVVDKTQQLKPGMFVEVKIVVGEKENTLVIPRKSITYKQDKAYVFVFQHMKVSQREITLGVVEEDQVEVLSGLDEGERIVTVGIEGLKDGMNVRVAR